MHLSSILAALSAARDKDARKAILIAMSIPLIAILLIITLIVYILASPLGFLYSFFGGEEYALVEQFKAENDFVVAGYVDLSFCGIFPIPFDHDGDVRVASPFGYRIHPIYKDYRLHTGIDFGTAWHCNIYSIADGVVISAGVNGGYGNCVVIKHETYLGTIYSLYAHLSEIKVSVGQSIAQGELIALEGGEPGVDPNHGTSTGHHLHFEIRDNSYNPVDPKDFLNIGEPVGQ